MLLGEQSVAMHPPLSSCLTFNVATWPLTLSGTQRSFCLNVCGIFSHRVGGFVPEIVRFVAVRRKKVPATLHIPSIPSCSLPSCPTPLYFLHASLFYGHFGHLHPAPTTQMDTFRSTSVCLMLGSFWKKVGILGWTKCSFCLACERFLERGWMSEFVHCICIDQFLWPRDFPPRKLGRYCGSDGKEPRKIWSR